MRMMIVLMASVAAVASLAGQQPRTAAEGAAVPSFYDVKVRMLDGKPADLGQYRGSVTLVVNVASFCGYTPQYEGLEALHRELRGEGFSVLGFPSNDFGEQEPGTAQEIAQFCRTTYGVTFPMFEKVVTRKGAGQSPVYAFLGAAGQLPSWNFGKYLIDRGGRVAAFFASEVTPEDPRLRAAIARALAG